MVSKFIICFGACVTMIAWTLLTYFAFNELFTLEYFSEKFFLILVWLFVSLVIAGVALFLGYIAYEA